jgi:hypothetical protein
MSWRESFRAASWRDALTSLIARLHRKTRRVAAPRGRHGIAGDFIRFENAPTVFGMRQCELILAADPQKATGGSIGAAGGDALIDVHGLEISFLN